MIYEVINTKKVEPLFAGWQETMILSCLQKVMGHLYTDNTEEPSSVMALLGDFCFFAGEPNRELALYKPNWREEDFVIMVPQHEAWATLIEECYQGKSKKVTRYAIKKEPDIFDRVFLQNVVNTLPEDYELQMMDEQLFWQCKDIDWCRDWVAQYEDYEQYRNHGLGAIILRNGEPVSGASSYSGYQGGIEIEIDTKEEYRRKGLAFVCGAKLILACLERGWYPSWDAQNKWSVALAEKLGYHFDHEYVAYEIYEY